MNEFQQNFSNVPGVSGGYVPQQLMPQGFLGGLLGGPLGGLVGSGIGGIFGHAGLGRQIGQAAGGISPTSRLRTTTRTTGTARTIGSARFLRQPIGSSRTSASRPDQPLDRSSGLGYADQRGFAMGWPRYSIQCRSDQRRVCAASAGTASSTSAARTTGSPRFLWQSIGASRPTAGRRDRRSIRPLATG